MTDDHQAARIALLMKGTVELDDDSGWLVDGASADPRERDLLTGTTVADLEHVRALLTMDAEMSRARTRVLVAELAEAALEALDRLGEPEEDEVPPTG